MYQVNEKLKRLFWKGNRQVVRATLLTVRDGNIVIREDEIKLGGINIDRTSTSGQSIEIGSAIASDLSIRIKNEGGKYNNVQMRGAELKLEIGVVEDDDTTIAGWIPCGVFVIDENPRHSETMEIKAMDRMVYFDDLVDLSVIKTPIKLKDLIPRLCTICGVQLATTNLSGYPNADYLMGDLADESGLGYSQDVSYRNLLQQACVLMCSCAFFNADGKLEVKWYEDTGQEYSPQTRYGNPDIHDYESKISGIFFSHNEEVNGTTLEKMYAAGTIDNGIDISDVYILDHDIQTVLNNIYNKAKGLSYIPYECEVKSSPWIFPMDIITQVRQDGSKFKSIVTSVSVKTNGVTSLTGTGVQPYSYSNSRNSMSKNMTKIIEGAKYQLKRYYEEINALAGNFDSLHAQVADIDQAYISKADIEVEHVIDSYINNLFATNISATDLSATNASFQNLQAGLADINTLVTGNAVITNESVINLTADNTVIANGLISDAMINNVSANKLTTGEIDASKVKVRNLTADSIRTDNLTIGGMTIIVTDDKKEVTLNGDSIEDGTIKLSGLSEEVRTIIDGALQTYTSDAIPTMVSYPTTEWNESEYKNHVGSICYVVNPASEDDGRAYRFVYDKASNDYMWYLIQDSDITNLITRVGNIEKFEEDISKWKDVTDRSVETLTIRTTEVETSLGQKVNIDTFNDVKTSLDENSATITNLKTYVDNMQVGGRNYISESSIINNNSYNTIVTFKRSICGLVVCSNNTIVGYAE